MDKKFFNSLYILNHILNFMLFIVSPIMLFFSNNFVMNGIEAFFFVVSGSMIIFELFAFSGWLENPNDRGFIKYLTEKEYNAFIPYHANHSRHCLHDKTLDFKTNIDNIRIDNHDALSILTELNDTDIPKYQKYNEYLIKIKSLKPISEKNHDEQETQLNRLNEQKRILKTQILAKTQQIKNIIDNEKSNREQQEFSNEYEELKSQIDKL